MTTLAEPLDVVLRNLVENAVKHHDTKVGVIALSAHEDGAYIRFEVADDGPGIDPSYHEAIFEPFRTVAEEAPPESSGIGLALVKKISRGRRRAHRSQIGPGSPPRHDIPPLLANDDRHDPMVQRPLPARWHALASPSKRRWRALNGSRAELSQFDNGMHLLPLAAIRP